MNRPVGVTILAVLQAVGSIILLFSGFSALSSRSSITQQLPQSGAPAQGEFVTIFSILLLVVGLISLLLAYGLFKLKGWAWITTLVLQALNAINSVIVVVSSAQERGGAVLQLVISLVIVYYLLRPAVKRAFGR